jgi:cystathionine beta-lyase
MNMNDEFHLSIDRWSSDSVKWGAHAPDVLPLWVADMDFRSPSAVLEALAERVAHGVFGYGKEPRQLAEVIAARLAHLYAWEVSPGDIMFLPGVVPGLYLSCRAFTEPGARVVVQTPVYPPIRRAPADSARSCVEVGFVRGDDGQYNIDWDALGQAFDADARLFILCNPQNPLGRVFSRGELARIAEHCVRRDVVICSDEIHCDLAFAGHRHVPIASLSPEVAQRTITLMAPSKTYNLAGLDCSFAVIQNPALRARFQKARRGLVPHVNILGLTAALAAYRDGQSWLDEVLAYLTANRDALVDQVRDNLPGVRVAAPEGTYLAWLDCRHSLAAEQPYQFFLTRAKVALSDGLTFGPGGEGHVRLNFGCRRAVLLEAIARMRRALEKAEDVR